MKHPRLTRAALCVLAIAGAGGAIPSAAKATCYSSTPATQSFADSPADGDAGLAPEIVSADVALNASCGLAVGATLVGADSGLISDEGVGVYLNTDGNPSTGSPSFGGADKVVMFVGALGTDLPPGLGTWDGTTMSFANSPSLPALGPAAATTSVDQLGIAAPTTLGIEVGAIYNGIYDTYADWAPEIGQPSFAFPMTFSTTQPVANVIPVSNTVAEDEADSGDSTYTCKVPKLKGLTVARARRKLDDAGCDYVFKKVRSKQRRVRVTGTIPSAGRSAAKAVVVRVSRGRKAAKASAAAVSLYAAADRALRLAE
jgi:hypothetical protein